MALIDLVNAFLATAKTKILNKTAAESISPQDEYDCFSELAQLVIPDGIISGLQLSVSSSNALIQPGTWKINGVNYITSTVTTIALDARDGTYSRYDVFYGDSNGQIHMVSGALSLTPFEPVIPDGTIKIGTVLITTTTSIPNNPSPTDYVNTTGPQDVGGVKNITDGLTVPLMPLGDDSDNAASTEFIQNELNNTAIWFQNGSLNGSGTEDDPYSIPTQSFGELTGNPSDNTALNAALNNKVDKEVGFGLSSNDYTSAEKTKLANISNLFVGKYTSLANLQAAYPTGFDGAYGLVEVLGDAPQEYIWDSTNSDWAESGGGGAVTTVNGQTGAVSLSTDNIGEGSTNKYFTAARVLAVVLTGISFGTVSAALATDNLLVGLGKIQAQITNIYTLLSGGTTGQVFAKVDNTSLNVEWIDPPGAPAADGIISGLGISIAGLNVTVAAGTYRVNGTIYTESGSTGLTLAAADPTDNRIDLIYGDNTGTLGVVTGTVAVNPVKPALPANSAEIGFALVTPSDTSVTTSALADYVTHAELDGVTGDLTTLVTDSKDTIVDAVNEVAENVASLSQDNVVLKIFKRTAYNGL